MSGWRQAVVASVTCETANARTLQIEVPGWEGHAAGQHVDVRVRAEDGYTASRSYSIASSASSTSLSVTVDRLDDGEVSPYLVDVIAPGDHLEIRGPTGGWFVWRPNAEQRPVQLIGGGSGVVPLMSMIRSHGDLADTTPFRLLYAVRSPGLAIFRQELLRRAADPDLAVDWAFSRETPEGWGAPPSRLDLAAVRSAVFPADSGALAYVCGATPFVEAAANWLLDLGYPPTDIRTERYGG